MLDADRSVPSRLTRLGHGLRSGLFFAVYFIYMLLGLGIPQRLVVWPLVTLLPRRRRAIVRWWIRRHAEINLWLMRVVGGVRISVRGVVPRGTSVAIMNHQSVLDIPVGEWCFPDSYAIIPTRERYRHGVPGISPLGRLAGFVYLSQKKPIPRAELQGLIDGAERVARGEHSMLIFPEGHRSRTGAIGPFMRNGLRLVLPRAGRPIYCIVADGMWRCRTIADTMVNFSGSEIRIHVLGPFEPPAPDAVDSFIEEIRARMVDALEALRAEPAGAAARGIDDRRAAH